MSCDVCGEREAIVTDLRPRRDLLEKGYEYTYKSPLNCYREFLVCNECFHLDDKPFFKKFDQTEKMVALSNT